MSVQKRHLLPIRQRAPIALAARRTLEQVVMKCRQRGRDRRRIELPPSELFGMVAAFVDPGLSRLRPEAEAVVRDRGLFVDIEEGAAALDLDVARVRNGLTRCREWGIIEGATPDAIAVPATLLERDTVAAQMDWAVIHTTLTTARSSALAFAIVRLVADAYSPSVTPDVLCAPHEMPVSQHAIARALQCRHNTVLDVLDVAHEAGLLMRVGPTPRGSRRSVRWHAQALFLAAFPGDAILGRPIEAPFTPPAVVAPVHPLAGLTLRDLIEYHRAGELTEAQFETAKNRLLELD